MASGPIYDSYYKQLQNTVDRLQTQVEIIKRENVRLKTENEQLRIKLSTVYNQVNREWVAVEESVSRSMLSLKAGLRNAVAINEGE
jgi:regulator of replication initiation timing